MNSVDPGLSIDARRHFLQALRRVLRPIVKLLIRSGIRYDEFADVARTAYVDSAIRYASGGASRPTRSQIAWMTGISRERVDHYIENDEAVPAVDPVSTQALTEVLHRWHTDSQYLGPSGAPLELEYAAPVGPSFRNLVAQIDARASAELILEKLLHSGAIAHTEDDRIRAVSRCLILPGEVISRIDYWGATLAHMIETLEHNLTSSNAENKRLERSVFADRGLPGQLLPEFHSFTRECTDEFLLELDDWLGQHADLNTSETSPKAGIGVNVFFFAEAPVDSTPLSTLVQGRRKSTRSESGR